MIRQIGIVGSWAIWIAGFVVAVTTNAPQWVVVGIFLLGFGSYLLALKVLERPSCDPDGGEPPGD